MKKSIFINYISAFIYLIPASLIIGAAVSEFFVSFTALLFLIYTIVYKDWFYYKKKNIYFFNYFFYLHCICIINLGISSKFIELYFVLF